MSQAERKSRSGIGNNIEQLASRICLLGILIFIVSIVVLAAYWPALSAKALSFDDESYLLENKLVQNPSWASAGRFFGEVLEPSTVEGYYQPLTMMSLMLDYVMGGRPNNLVVFHQTSLALHILNTALIIVLLYLLFGQVLAATIVGLLFGVHPLTVEAIPWVAERKTLLAAFLALWSLIFYVQYARGGNRKLYISSAVLYVLALMSKPTSIPLPFLMMLLDYWPLRRLSKKTVLEKIPFFIICVIFGIIAFISQRETFGVHMPGEYGLKHIVLTICHNIVLYLSNAVWPANLSLFYPFPQPMDLSHPEIFTGVIGTIILLIGLLISLRWTRALLTGWLFFFVAIFPTMGVVKFHDMIAADRHMYLPFVGMLLILVYFLYRFWDRAANVSARKVRQVGTLVVVIIIVALQVSTTRGYLVYWKDTETHHRQMLAKAPEEAVVHNVLALELYYQGRFDEAVMHYTKALEIRPNDAEMHNNLAGALLAQGKLEEAISHYHQALQIKFDLADVHYNLGSVLLAHGKFDEAANHFHKVLQLKPDDANAYYKLGIVFRQLGKHDEALRYFQQALQIEPENIQVQKALHSLKE